MIDKIYTLRLTYEQLNYLKLHINDCMDVCNEMQRLAHDPDNKTLINRPSYNEIKRSINQSVKLCSDLQENINHAFYQ